MWHDRNRSEPLSRARSGGVNAIDPSAVGALDELQRDAQKRQRLRDQLGEDDEMLGLMENRWLSSDIYCHQLKQNGQDLNEQDLEKFHCLYNAKVSYIEGPGIWIKGRQHKLKIDNQERRYTASIGWLPELADGQTVVIQRQHSTEHWRCIGDLTRVRMTWGLAPRHNTDMSWAERVGLANPSVPTKHLVAPLVHVWSVSSVSNHCFDDFGRPKMTTDYFMIAFPHHPALNHDSATETASLANACSFAEPRLALGLGLYPQIKRARSKRAGAEHSGIGSLRQRWNGRTRSTLIELAGGGDLKQITVTRLNKVLSAARIEVKGQMRWLGYQYTLPVHVMHLPDRNDHYEFQLVDIKTHEGTHALARTSFRVLSRHEAAARKFDG
ncbi:hypothetical protein ACM66B_006336 [Microbotryomycetes sp. NB124-2]